MTTGNISLQEIRENWLDVGCGPSKIPGAVGIDLVELPGVDVVHDLNLRPWPFEANTFARICCRHSLSHLENLVTTMEEIHRIAKPDAVVEIVAPHFTSDNFNTDPTHKFHMGYRSMNYFCDNVEFRYRYYSRARFELLARQISFRNAKTDFPRLPTLNPARWLGIEQIINALPRVYERFFCYVLPASEVYFKLRVVKSGQSDEGPVPSP